MDAVDVLIIVVKVVVAFGLWLVGTALMIWFERRLVAKMQSRIGPNRLGPFGLMQTLADGAKLFFKEDITPTNVDRWVYVLAPVASAVVAMVTFAVIPFGGTFEVAGREVALQVWDPDIGLLWILAMSSLGVYGIVLAGWASGSKYPLLGGVRSSAQMISYELAMGLGLAAVFIYTGSLQSSAVVEAQRSALFTVPVVGWGVPAWNIIPQIPAFALFFGAAVAETQRPPFDLPEAEGELVAGFHTEYSGAKFAMFFLAEFMQVITMSAVTVTLFFGGPAGPVPSAIQGTIFGALLGTVYFLLKVGVFLAIFVWLRGTLPRLRYDRLMDLGWKVLLPFGLLWVLLTGTIVVAQNTVDRTQLLRYAAIAFAVVVAAILAAPLLSRLPGGEPGDEDETPEAPDRTPSAGIPVGNADSARRAASERTPDQMVL